MTHPVPPDLTPEQALVVQWALRAERAEATLGRVVDVLVGEDHMSRVFGPRPVGANRIVEKIWEALQSRGDA
jgi:hypothetical protein